MNKKRSFLGRDIGPIAAFLAVAGILLHLAALALVAPIGSPFDALSWRAGLGAFDYEICFHAAPSSAHDQPELPAPQNKRAHDCVLCCAPASLAGTPAPAMGLPIRREARADRMTASTPTLAGLSIHVVRQRGPPTV
jgi:hypothetical protein